MLEFYVTKGQELKRLDHDVVSADTTDLKAQFDLTSDFTGTITVWWRRSDKPGSTWTSTLAADGTCTIPAEALSAATDNVMYGQHDHFVFVSISDTGRTTSSECEIRVNKSAFSTNATPGTGGSPTAYEELVEQFDELKADNQTFKDDMTQQQTEFESTVTENVDNIRYVVETETAPPIIDEASGAEITLDDSAYRQVRDLQLYGYSKQIQTTGAQILDASKIPASLNGITTTIDDDGYIVLNGTSTNIVFLPIPVSLGSGTQVYVSAGNPTADNNVFVRLSAASGEIIAGDLSLTIANATDAWTISKAATQFIIRVSMGVTLTNFRLRPMLSLGSSPLPWEPYSGGVASPSPDWPQPIKSVADEVNLYDCSGIDDVTAGGASIKNNGDGSFTISGNGNLSSQISTYVNFTHEETLNIIQPGYYTISGAQIGSPYILASIIYNNGESYLELNTKTISQLSNEISQEILDDETCYLRLGFYGASGQQILAQTVYPMLNSGTTALPWRPYGHNMTVESEVTNLLNFPDVESVVIDGVMWSCEGGVVSATGNATGQASTLYSDLSYIFPIKAGTYKISGANSKTYVIAKITSADDSIEYPSSKFTLDGTEKEVRIYVRAANTGVISSTIYPMINRGSSPLPWQPYVTPSSALITLTDSLRGIPVDSGGNYTDESGQQWIADYIYRRQTDGKWMLWRNCGSVVYDGSEDEGWRLDSNFTRYYSINKTGFQESTTARRRSMNSLFRLGTSGETTGGNNVYTITDTSSIYIALTHTETIEDLTALLAQKPMTLVGILATPTIEELPADVQAELNGLYTYSLHTDMWNNDGAYMNLKYVADTKTWINNKIAGLSTAMLNQN